MSKNNPTQHRQAQDADEGPAFQQFTAGEACMATPEPPYDVEKMSADKVKPAPRPAKKGPGA